MAAGTRSKSVTVIDYTTQQQKTEESFVSDEGEENLKRVSFLLREDVAKLGRLDKETLFLTSEGITTMEQLSSRKGAAEGEMESLTAQRKELWREYRQLTRQGDQPAADEIRGQIRQLSQRIGKLQKEVSLCDGISQRSRRVKDGLEQLLSERSIECKEREVLYAHSRGYTIRK